MINLCNKLINPPENINNIYINSYYTGSVQKYIYGTYDFCNSTETIPKSSIWIGRYGPFSYTLTFSISVNNIQIILAAMGNRKNYVEEFAIYTNSGIPTITINRGCAKDIKLNRILGTRDGGIYTISSEGPYTELKIEGIGGGGGSLLGICSNSIPKTINDSIPITTTLRPTTTPRPILPDPEFFAKIGQDIIGEYGGDDSGTTLSLNGVGDIVVIGAPLNNNAKGIRSGQTRVYSWEPSLASWVQIGNDIDGNSGGDQSGACVTMNAAGDIIAISAPGDRLNGSDGTTIVVQWDGYNWIQLGEPINGRARSSRFSRPEGLIVLNAIGDTIAISSYELSFDEDLDPVVKIYRWDGISWNLLGNSISFGTFGSNIQSISFNDDAYIIAIGHRDVVGEDWRGDFIYGGVISTYFYEEDDNTWVKYGKVLSKRTASEYASALKIYSRTRNDMVSVSLSDDGNIMAVGSPEYDGEVFVNKEFQILETKPAYGSVSVYRWNSQQATWIQLGQEILGSTVYNRIGHSVSLNGDGDVLAIGDHIEIYNWDSNQSLWIKKPITDFGLNNLYSTDIKLNHEGNRIAVGSSYLLGMNRSGAIVTFGTASAGDVKIYQFPKSTTTTTTTTTTLQPDPNLLIIIENPTTTTLQPDPNLLIIIENPITTTTTAAPTTTTKKYNCKAIPTLYPPLKTEAISVNFTTANIINYKRPSISINPSYPLSNNILEPTTTITTTSTTTETSTTTKNIIVNVECYSNCNKLNY
jgi:hypothetical protein